MSFDLIPSNFSVFSECTVLEKSQASRWLLVLAGVVLGQFFLYGPSLLGKKILLPLDVLTAPGIYLPPTEPFGIHPENYYLSDLVYLSEPMRLFAHSEFAAGRLPMWADYQYAGAPFLGPKFSPFVLPQYLVRSPSIIAWAQLFAACVAGLGMCIFCERVLQLSALVGIVMGCAYPLTGFFILWQGYYLVWPVYWLPWLLTAIHATVSGSSPYAPPGLAVITGLTVVSGNIDTAGQCLIIAGLFALWIIVAGKFSDYSQPGESTQAFLNRGNKIRPALATAVALGLGLLLATPHLLPFSEYSRTGARIQLRGVGLEERPPVGLRALPQIVLPDMYGAQAKARTGFRYAKETQLESSAAAYSGLLVTLLLAPLAFLSRKHRSISIFLAAIIILGLSWTLNVPGFVQMLRLPGLNLMSHNRLVFGAAFGSLSLAAIGLEHLREGIRGRAWLVPAVFLAVTFCWSSYRAFVLPPELESLPKILQSGGQLGWIMDVDSVAYVQELFRLQYAVAAGFCLAGLLTLWVMQRSNELRSQMAAVLSLLVLTDLFWFSHGRNPQVSRDLHYPPLKALTELQEKGIESPQRVIAYKTLPPQLLSTFGLRDVRGYDGVDPAAFLELISLSGEKSAAFQYALLQWFTPTVSLSEKGEVLLHPVLDLLGVTHVIFRGTPTPEARPVIVSDPYWILRNPNALPEAFVPRRVEVQPDRSVRLRQMHERTFNPEEVAFVEQPLRLNLPERCVGKTVLKRYSPTHLKLDLQMETDGLVVLTDLWVGGWKAYLDGKAVPILVVNNALRGVIARAGMSELEFRYKPGSFVLGVLLGSISVTLISAWSLAIYVRKWRNAG